MARKNMKLVFITSDASRKATYMKRKAGLLKKVSELSILCGIEACALIYSSYDAHPEVWPSVPEAERVISKFKRMPEPEQKKMINQESFIREMITKKTEKLNKERQNNMEKEKKETMYECLMGASVQNLSASEFDNLVRALESIKL